MAVGDAHVIPGFLTPVLDLTQLSSQSHRLLFSHAVDVRGENTPKRKFASTGYRTHSHQVTSQTRSPLSQSVEEVNINHFHFSAKFAKVKIGTVAKR